MALIKCPECGGLVSDRAKKCPHCGCPMEKILLLQEQNPIPDSDVKTIPENSVISNEELVNQDKVVEQNIKEEEQQQEEVKPVETNNEKESVVGTPTIGDKTQLKKLGIISAIAVVVLLSCYFLFGHKRNTGSPKGAESSVNNESTENINWMVGNWFSETSNQFLLVHDGMIYWDSYNPDEEFVFDPFKIPRGVFEIGKILQTRQDWDTKNWIIDSRTTFGIRNFDTLSSDSLELFDYQWDEIEAQLMNSVTRFTSTDFSFVALTYVEDFSEWLVFSNRHEKRLFVVEFDRGAFSNFVTFSRIKPTKQVE